MRHSKDIQQQRWACVQKVFATAIESICVERLCSVKMLEFIEDELGISKSSYYSLLREKTSFYILAGIRQASSSRGTAWSKSQRFQLAIEHVHEYVFGGFTPPVDAPPWLQVAAAAHPELLHSPSASSQLQFPASKGLWRGDRHIGFQILAGDKTAQRPIGDITLNWENDKTFTPPAEVLNYLWGAMFDVQYMAFLKYVTIHFRPLARVVKYESSGEGICLQVERTMYSHFAATNLNADYTDHLKTLKINEEWPSIGSRYYSNALNVVFMMISEDEKTFIPRRSRKVFESPDMWQASVGGFIEYNESPTKALCREIIEEWGLSVYKEDVKTLAFGINLFTGEPDIIGFVRCRASEKDIKYAYEYQTRHKEFKECPEAIDLKKGVDNVVKECLIRELQTSFSGPSDQAALYLTLANYFGESEVQRAFRQAQRNI